MIARFGIHLKNWYVSPTPIDSGAGVWDNKPTKWGKVGFGGVKPPKRTDVLLPSGESERMFVGTFEHTIDDKGRLTLPAKWRTELVGGVFITRGADK